MNRYYDRLLPLFRQFLLLPNRSNKFMNLQANCSTPTLTSSADIWSIPGDLWLYSLSITNSTSEALGSGTSGSAVCISVCPTSLTPCTLNGREKYSLIVLFTAKGNSSQSSLFRVWTWIAGPFQDWRSVTSSPTFRTLPFLLSSSWVGEAQAGNWRSNLYLFLQQGLLQLLCVHF